MTISPCAGVIVFNDNIQTVIVKSKSHYGFPKGKRHKGENLLETALRELYEETGISPENINILCDDKNVPINMIEYSQKNNISVTYFIANLLENDNSPLKFDPNELEQVEWRDVDSAAQILTLKGRSQILKEALLHWIDKKT